MITIIWKTEDLSTKREPKLRVSAVAVTTKKMRHLGSITQSYQSDTHMLMELLARQKVLPSEAFEPGQYGGFTYLPHTLEAAGFARVYHL